MVDANDPYIRKTRIDKALRELEAVSKQLTELGIKHRFQVEGWKEYERTRNGSNN